MIDTSTITAAQLREATIDPAPLPTVFEARDGSFTERPMRTGPAAPSAVT